MITSTSTNFTLDLAVCSWVLWGVALISAASRFVSRRLQVGPSFFIRGFEADDYLMVLTVVALTRVAVSSNEVAINGSNYVPHGETDEWSAEQVDRAAWGSKMLVALEEFMLATLWLVKACLLILYARMTAGLREALAVKITAAYCVITFAVVQILYLALWCRPITNYWAVPIPEGNEQCKTYHNHLITVTVLHVSSDILMLAVPLPVIARSRLPLRRKLVLCGVFGLGIVVVLLAVLNRYYNFVMPHDLVFLAWYNGEAATAVLIANMPFCWALMRKIFALGPWKDPSAGIGKGAHVGPPTTGGSGGRGRRPADSEWTSRTGGESESTERIAKNAVVGEIELAERCREIDRITGSVGRAEIGDRRRTFSREILGRAGVASL